MKLGLCLSGGGAKGSYQAGVIKALYDRGIKKFYSISGTSIGAFNGYFIFTENVENLEKMWTNIQIISEESVKIINNTVDNSELINSLRRVNNNLQEKINFYVNYIEVENKSIKERVVNLNNLEREKSLESITYSSLLPFNPKGTLNIVDQFKKDLKEGFYDGYKLDGGLVKNTLIEPLIEDNLDKLIIIATRHDYILPENIKGKYNESDVIIVRPKTMFDKKDTLRFEYEFCKNMFKEGYEIGKDIKLDL